jgi:Transposase DDE domain group 1
VKELTDDQLTRGRQTECFSEPLLFQDLGERKVVADFSGGRLSSDGGALLLRQVDAGLGLSRALARCFSDRRRQDLIEHHVPELLAQRLYALALGYEDLNDHAELRRDPLLAAAAGKSDVLGEKRRCVEHRGFALASASTLNRLELSAQFEDYYRKVHPDAPAVGATLLEMGVRCLPKDAGVLVLDFDATDDPLHGRQEGRFFHGYYDTYCYLPLFCFCGDVVLWAQLRTADRDASDGSVEALAQIVAAIRQRMPKVKIVVRADSGFAREAIMAWCEAQEEIFYCIGLARNDRLEALLSPALAAARAQHCLCGGASVRRFAELTYRTLDSWSRPRRVIGKAEASPQGDNPRFLVTNIDLEGLRDRQGDLVLEAMGRSLYEDFYCERGQAENRIKQMTLDLQSDRTSTHWLSSNQMRLWLSAFAYLLLERLRAWGLRGSALERATLGSVRLRLLKVAAQVRVSVRRVYVQLCSAFPLQGLFARCQQRLAAVESS